MTVCRLFRLYHRIKALTVYLMIKTFMFMMLQVFVKLSVKSLVTVTYMYVVGLGPYISGFQPFETPAPLINLVSQTTTQIGYRIIMDL